MHMSLRKGLFGLGMFIFCFGMVCAKTVKVDCFKGKSINAVLNAHKNAEELIIEIDGTCKEDVIVQRDNVTLIGINPKVAPGLPADGIEAASMDDAPPFFGTTVTIRASLNVTLENLRITGGARNGIVVLHSGKPQAGRVIVSNCLLENNNIRGLGLFNSHVRVEDTTFSGNGIGITANESVIRCFDCTFDEDSLALAVLNHSLGTLIHSTVDGSYRAINKSLIKLRDTDQMDNPDGNVISDDSQLQADHNSSVLGPSTFSIFSSGFLASERGGFATHTGDMTCESGSDVFCDDPTTQIIDGTSDCSSCMPSP